MLLRGKGAITELADRFERLEAKSCRREMVFKEFADERQGNRQDEVEQSARRQKGQDMQASATSKRLDLLLKSTVELAHPLYRFNSTTEFSFLIISYAS